MSSKAKSTEMRERAPRKLRDQPHAFVGLYLAPVPALLTAWLIHVYVMGVDLHWGRLHWHVVGNQAALVVTVALLSVGAVGIGTSAWHFAEHRKPAMRYILTGFSSALVFIFAINVGLGPHRWWSGGFILLAEYVAGTWSMARLNVTRADPRTPEGDDGEGLLERWGLKGYRGKVTEVVTDDQGRPVRTEINVKHAPGGTIDPVQQAVPNMESYVGAPAGFSRAVPSDRADQSQVTILHSDPLKGRLLLGPPSHPGGSITDPVITSLYDDGHPVRVPLTGGAGFPPTNRGWVGMTRTGKTVNENLTYTEIITRRDVVIMYLNRSKGMQDIRPIIPGVEVAIITAADADYVSALHKVEAIMHYRSGQLGRYGISAWSANRCFHNPPQRRSDGQAIPMEPMPSLQVHIGEADSILEGRGGDQAERIASKCLSLGIQIAVSLQRASAEHMPTSMRQNIGLWWCFGTGDDYSASFVLGDHVVKAGADPQRFGQRMPGNHYVVGPGIEEANFAKRAKTFAIAAGTDPNVTDEVIDMELQEAMLARNLQWAPRMAKLDRGSAAATGVPGSPGNWWDLAVAETDRIRKTILGGTATVTASNRNPTTATAPAATAGYVATDPQPHETAEHLAARAEVDNDVADVRNVEGVELYPQDENGRTGERIDLSADLPAPDPDFDLSWEDPRPPAMSRNDAVLALHEALRELIAVPELRDPADPTGNTVIFGMPEVVDRYKFRGRPWFIGEFSKMIEGEAKSPQGLILSRATDLDLSAGRYRLRRIEDGDAG